MHVPGIYVSLAASNKCTSNNSFNCNVKLSTFNNICSYIMRTDEGIVLCASKSPVLL